MHAMRAGAETISVRESTAKQQSVACEGGLCNWTIEILMFLFLCNYLSNIIRSKNMWKIVWEHFVSAFSFRLVFKLCFISEWPLKMIYNGFFFFFVVVIFPRIFHLIFDNYWFVCSHCFSNVYNVFNLNNEIKQLSFRLPPVAVFNCFFWLMGFCRKFHGNETAGISVDLITFWDVLDMIAIELAQISNGMMDRFLYHPQPMQRG